MTQSPRSVFVAGASQGIGLAIARQFLTAGDHVTLAARNQAKLDTVVAGLNGEFNGRASGLAADLTAETLPATVLDALDQAEVVVLNFGATDTPPGFDTDDTEWNRLMAANLNAPARLARLAARSMSARGKGAILFIGSIAGREELGAPIAYTVGKAGLRALVKSMARQLGPSGVRVNMISPGNILFDGGRWAEKLAARPDEIGALIHRLVPLRRFGRPEEIAQAAMFLCSDQAGFVTGSDLVVDGGQTAAI